MDFKKKPKKYTEKVDPQLLSRLSSVVSTALYLEGKSSYGSGLCKNYALCIHDLVEPRFAHESKIYLGGSHAEGTKTPWSDSDGMKVLPNVIVRETHKTDDSIESNILLMETKDCRPGFTRLLPAKCLKDPNDMFSSVVENVDGLFKESEAGSYYLSSQKFGDHFVSVHKYTVQDIPTHYRHGPCATALQDLSEYAVNDLESDMAHALRCEDWPSGAQEWFTRKRHYDWPSKETIEIIRQQDCHVVPVGDPRSTHTSEEWRISFLFGERELVWSFNDTQLQCYYILKCLLKLELDNLAPDQLSSYHMKTIMFWQCENSQFSVWTPCNLLQCVRTCLIELKKAIEMKRLEHFFDRRRNLLSSKFDNEAEKLAIMERIETLLADIVAPVMQNTRCKKILDAWNCSQNLETFLMIVSLMDVPKCKALADFTELCDSLQTAYIQFSHWISYPQIGPLLKGMDKNLQSGRLDALITDYLKCFLEIIAGLELCILETKQEDISLKKSMIKDAKIHFVGGSKFNVITGKLYLATFLFCKDDYSCVSSILYEIKKHFTGRPLYYAGVSSPMTSVCFDDNGYVEQGDFASYLDDITPENGAVYDVVFSCKDLPFVPYALKFECVLLLNRSVDIICLHPAVYFYFLMFLNEMCMANYFRSVKSLLLLEKAVKDCDHPVRTYRLWNLLGYCYSAIGEYSEAFKCYHLSLQKFPSVTNAAIYHMAILVTRLINVNSQMAYD